MKFKNYVGVMNPGSMKLEYVTRIDSSSKMAYWEKGEEAKAMPEKTAKELAEALCFNGYIACVVKAPAFVSGIIND